MSSARQKSLRLATWNTHYGIGADRRFDLTRITGVLEEIDGDIVGLQEVGWHRRTHHRIDHFAYLREHTDYAVTEGLVRDPLRSRFGNALLTRFPVLSTQWIDLKVRGHVPRAALLAVVETPVTRIHAVVLHLGLASWERERQARRLIEALDACEENLPTVLLGDFNMLRARSRAANIFAERFPHCLRLPTYPVRKPRLSLDRIYLSKEWRVTASRVLDQGLALEASDHLPLVTEARVNL